MKPEIATFEPLGAPAPVALVSARIELHWAAQIVAAVGRALIPAVADDSHTSLEWLETSRLLAGGITLGGSRLGLRPADLTLVLLDAQGSPRGELSLAGRTLDEARAWAAEGLGGAASPVPPYEMPPHVVAHGGRFSGEESAARTELARWYASADRQLRERVRSLPVAEGRASPVRCWPHHFDLATLIALPRRASTDARTIGVGLSPGDASYPEPYFYVMPWPYPENPSLPALPEGATWHRAGWVGAVLTGTALFAAAGSPAARAEAVARFLDLASRASAELLGFARDARY